MYPPICGNSLVWGQTISTPAFGRRGCSSTASMSRRPHTPSCLAATTESFLRAAECALRIYYLSADRRGRLACGSDEALPPLGPHGKDLLGQLKNRRAATCVKSATAADGDVVTSSRRPAGCLRAHRWGVRTWAPHSTTRGLRRRRPSTWGEKRRPWRGPSPSCRRVPSCTPPCALSFARFTSSFLTRFVT